MLHLNNRGWGMGVMIIFLCIFIIAIIIISILAYHMGVGGKVEIGTLSHFL